MRFEANPLPKRYASRRTYPKKVRFEKNLPNPPPNPFLQNLAGPDRAWTLEPALVCVRLLLTA